MTLYCPRAGSERHLLIKSPEPVAWNCGALTFDCRGCRSGWVVMGSMRPADASDWMFCALLQRLETLHGDSGEMREHIRAAAVGLDEPEALGIVEPFDCTARHFSRPLVFPLVWIEVSWIPGTPVNIFTY